MSNLEFKKRITKAQVLSTPWNMESKTWKIESNPEILSKDK